MTKPLVKPMRSADLKGDIGSVVLPAYGSPKMDGYRATNQNEVLYSKNLKPIPNGFTQRVLSNPLLQGLDGELIVGDVANDPLQRTSSGVTTREGTPDVYWWVFDRVDMPGAPFSERLAALRKQVAALPDELAQHVRIARHVLLKTKAEVLAREQQFVEAGYEGMMIRRVDGLYKPGRATLIEGYCSKLKRRQDFEARIVRVNEQTTNTNVAKVNEVGESKRSTHKAGKVAKGRLGSFTVVGINGRWQGVEFEVGSGPTDAQRIAWWKIRDTLPGQIIKVMHGKTPATFKRPQFPVFVDFRTEDDI